MKTIITLFLLYLASNGLSQNLLGSDYPAILMFLKANPIRYKEVSENKSNLGERMISYVDKEANSIIEVCYFDSKLECNKVLITYPYTELKEVINLLDNKSTNLGNQLWFSNNTFFSLDKQQDFFALKAYK
jgi:hypothetical protein